MVDQPDPYGLDKFRKMSSALSLSDPSIGNIFERMNHVMTCVINKGNDKSIRSALISLKNQKEISMRDESRPNAIRNLIYQMVDPFASSLETLMERERRDEMDDVVVDPSSPQQQPSPSAQIPQPSSSSMPGGNRTGGMLGNIKREGERNTNIVPEYDDTNRFPANPQMPESGFNARESGDSGATATCLRVLWATLSNEKRTGCAYAIASPHLLHLLAYFLYEEIARSAL
ncbi:hypothetical protein PRIPAC_75848 [Pristionchus pacificus]|uniref:Uncharacterized protein n=1 Tax=Pristionchus pacificus TaxID=54126 RepID=A0A2A6C7D6_PRIPA|nr:hypothetical protein PRIPAC_75848 [Pristionchus pacificus]|eukprot:PDM74094.1 hypothetical protein PRIPAC_41450 [Pristionchus pacificus]